MIKIFNRFINLFLRKNVTIYFDNGDEVRFNSDQGESMSNVLERSEHSKFLRLRINKKRMLKIKKSSIRAIEFNIVNNN